MILDQAFLSPPSDGTMHLRGLKPSPLEIEAKKACDLLLARTAAAGGASGDDRRAIISSVIETTWISSHQEPDRSSRSHANLRLVIEGWLYRVETLANGTCQITDILLPGDTVDFSAGDGFDIRACGRSQIAILRRDLATGREWSSLSRRWEWVRDAQARLLRSRLVSLGRRDARQRIAHFMAETCDRLHQVGLVEDGVFTCPLTQEQVADVLGLTSVHVNRVLQRLRQERLVLFDRPRVMIPDLARLRAAGLC